MALATLIAGGASAHEVTVDNCGDPLVFGTQPERPVVHDMNMTEMAFASGLKDKIVGLTGITGWYKTSPEFDQLRGDIPEIALKYPTIENLVAVEPDLFFAGWYYGMKPGGDMTPDTLEPFGIKTMILTESCVHLDKNRPAASMNLLFDDVLRLGKVMHVEDKAEELVKGWKEELAAIEAQTAQLPKPRGFLLDGPADAPFTAGTFAIPDAMIAAAGGENVTHDKDTSWGRTDLINLLGAVTLTALLLISTVYGTTPIPAMDTFNAVLLGTGVVEGEVGPTHRIVFDLRLPHALSAAVIGAGLGIVGVVLQTTTRNDPADPFLSGLFAIPQSLAGRPSNRRPYGPDPRRIGAGIAI